MSAPPRAVFLSYAREDAAVVRRIAEALRASGVEVWFDEDELRGGDAWDAKIKKQIRECALFVPMISAHTEERREGYFRREWKQAVQRLDDIADNVPFIVPVVTDGTAERGALVPDAFGSVQWTRLDGGETSAAFCARVKILLGGEAVAPIPSSTPSAPQKNATVGLHRLRRPAGAVLSGAVLVAVALLLAIWQPWRSAKSASPKTNGIPARPADEVARMRTSSGSSELGKGDYASGSAQKSIAVLAFENRSSEKDSEYFSDGISEELLNVLAKVPGLRVSGRASSFQFKGAKVSPAEIAQKLNVSYLVEGSVQRSGTRARITAQLTRASTGDTLWADKFDTELKDIFKAQDEIAGLIAQKLSLTLGMSTRTRSVNPEAHRLLLEGRYLWNLRTGQGLSQAESFFERAAALAPDFAELHADWALLEVIRGNTTGAWFGNLDMTADIQRGRHRALRALQLDPASGEAMAALAYSMQLDGNVDESERLFRRAIELRPNSSAIHSWFAQLLATRGDLLGGLEAHAKAYQLDPLSAPHVGVYVAELVRARRFSEAIQIGERIKLLHHTFVHTRAALGRAYAAVGRNQEALAEVRFVLEHPEHAPRWQSDIFAIAVLMRLGEVEEARRHAARLRATLVAGSFMQGYVLVAEGRFTEALPLLTRVPSLQARGIFYDEMWDRWRDDPRFSALVATLGFSQEYQRARDQLARITEKAAKE